MKKQKKAAVRTAGVTGEAAQRLKKQKEGSDEDSDESVGDQDDWGDWRLKEELPGKVVARSKAHKTEEQ